MEDTYKTIDKPSEESFLKEKGSKFYGYAFPLSKEADVKQLIEKLKKQHSSAGHFCYAWQVGTRNTSFKVHDDGEPKNSAGVSIHGQIRSFDVTNILVVSVRYFGGIKLGVGGLKQAYKYSAKLTLDAATIVEKTKDVFYQITFDHASMNRVMRIIKEKGITILGQESGMNYVYYIAVREGEKEAVWQQFERLYQVAIKEVVSFDKT